MNLQILSVPASRQASRNTEQVDIEASSSS